MVSCFSQAGNRKLAVGPPTSWIYPLKRGDFVSFSASLRTDAWLRQVMGSVNFADYESRMWFDKVLRDNGFFQKLEEAGIQDGDTVSLYDFEFEYQR